MFSFRLELFYSEQCRVRLQSPQVRRYLLQHTHAMDTLLTPAMLIEKGGERVDPYSDPVDEPQNDTRSAVAKLRCKMCRRELASEEHVVSHDPGRGELAFEPRKRDAVRKDVGAAPTMPAAAPHALPPQLARIHQAMAAGAAPRSLLHSSQCSAYFVEPLAWMVDSSDVVEGVVSGRLLCPNRACQAKLGSWTWAGTQCAW